MKRQWVEKPRPFAGSTYHSAVYSGSDSLADLIDIANMKAWPPNKTEAAEVPGMGIAVVRYSEMSDEGTMRTNYEVVESGDHLVYSPIYDVLYTLHKEDLQSGFEEVKG